MKIINFCKIELFLFWEIYYVPKYHFSNIEYMKFIVFKALITQLRKTHKGAGEVGQWLSVLPKIHEALGSKLSTVKNKKKRKKHIRQ
jgi:hypothetical protein